MNMSLDIWKLMELILSVLRRVEIIQFIYICMTEM